MLGVVHAHHTLQFGEFTHHVGDQVCLGQQGGTLGHGLEDDDVIRHAFYGTRRVLDDLARFPGWTQGHVTLTHADEVYSDEGLILAYRPAAVAVARQQRLEAQAPLALAA